MFNRKGVKSVRAKEWYLGVGACLVGVLAIVVGYMAATQQGNVLLQGMGQGVLHGVKIIL